MYDVKLDPFVTRPAKPVPTWHEMDAIHIAAAAYEAERKVMFAVGVQAGPWENLHEGERIAKMGVVEEMLAGRPEQKDEKETELARRLRMLRAVITAALSTQEEVAS